jgi:4-amino-4-deoxy-L-arabinose transferase-like glycosyltransferase
VTVPRLALLGRAASLVLVAIVFGLPLFVGLDNKDAQNDEGIYSYAAQSLIDTGDWLNPRSSPKPDVVFLEKPPLKFWIVALPIRLGLLPDNDFGLRFWDALFGACAFVYVFALGRRMGGWVCGATAVVILFASRDLLFQHGLLGNNMEAALFLTYCGGVYHFSRWAASAAEEAEGDHAGERGRRQRFRHALALGGLFVLGFMTKFVAAFFLPLVLVFVAFSLPVVRDRFLREWRTWAVVAGLIVLVCAPWFIYQWLAVGNELWQTMVASQVYQRFSAWLDKNHLHPWDFYFSQIWRILVDTRTAWLVVFGSLVLVTRVLVEDWFDGRLVLFWFALPLALMSNTTSKLLHYAYPFFPPLALAAGYGVAWVARMVCLVVSGNHGEFDRAPVTGDASALRLHAGLRTAFRLRGRVGSAAFAWTPTARQKTAIVTMASIAAVMALGFLVLARVHPDRIHVRDLLTWREPSAIVPAMIAVCLAAAVRRRSITALVVSGLLFSFVVPLAEYRATLVELAREDHPLRTLSECVGRVRAEQRRAGVTPSALVVWLPPIVFQHQYFSYFHRHGWTEVDGLSDEQIAALVNTPGADRPVLLPTGRFIEYLKASNQNGGKPLFRASAVDATMLLPAQFAQCRN